VRSGKSSKYEENEYKQSLGCLIQKPISALNLARIRGDKQKNFKIFPQKLVRSAKSSKYEENEYKSSLHCVTKKAHPLYMYH
jgi:hypothetical protein